MDYVAARFQAVLTQTVFGLGGLGFYTNRRKF
jgi:hypothetical protein